MALEGGGAIGVLRPTTVEFVPSDRGSAYSGAKTLPGSAHFLSGNASELFAAMLQWVQNCERL